MNNPNNRDNQPQIQPSLSPTRGITRVFAIFEPFSHLYHKFSCRNTPNNPNIRDQTPNIQLFSNNIEYTLQLQASTQPTMLRTVLDHNPKCFSDSLAQLQAYTDSQYPLLFVLSIVTLRGVCNYKIQVPHYLYSVLRKIACGHYRSNKHNERNLLHCSFSFYCTESSAK